MRNLFSHDFNWNGRWDSLLKFLLLSQMDKWSHWWSCLPSKWHSISRLRWWKKSTPLSQSSFSSALPTGAFLKMRKTSGGFQATHHQVQFRITQLLRILMKTNINFESGLLGFTAPNGSFWIIFKMRANIGGEWVCWSVCLFPLSQLLTFSLCFVFFNALCRLYSCLANGSPDEFQRGEQLYRVRAVKDPLQIGEKPHTSHAAQPT